MHVFVTPVRSASSLRLVLGSCALFLLAGYHPGSPDLDPGSATPEATTEAASDTVVVFVVWGSSNTTNVGNGAFSPDPAPGTAWEWYWRNQAQHPPRHLDDPITAWDNPGTTGSGGSMWPSFAVAYNALTGGAADGRTAFVTSLGKGGSSSEWNPGQALYNDGVQTITNAMAMARATFPGRPVVFGGVAWNLGPGLGGENLTYPWAPYRAALRDLLATLRDAVFENPSHAGYGGRFYLINTLIPRSYDYSDPEVRFEMDYGMDLEADVCAEFSFCSMVQASDDVKLASMACGGGNCEGWYSGDLHWGQRGLNWVGEAVGATAAAHGFGGGNTAPDAAFTYSCAGLSCAFTDQSSDPDGSIAARSWTFGDGAASTATNPTHAYGGPGSYTVTLTVTDGGGATDATSQTVTVTDGGPITLSVTPRITGPWVNADLTWSPADGGNVTVYRNGTAVATTPDGGAYSDRIGRNASGTFVYQVCETDSGGCSNEASVAFRVGASASARAAVEVSASPNPFEGHVTISYALAEPGEVSLAVFDLLGRRVALLAEGAQEAGAHRVVFDASALPGGVYVYRLQAGAEVRTGRLLRAR